MRDHPLQLQDKKGLGLRDVCICTDDVGKALIILSWDFACVAKLWFMRMISCCPLSAASGAAGLFQTSLSKELETVARAYSLSLAEVFDMQRTALNAAFCPQEMKDKLRSCYFSDLRKKEFLHGCTGPPSTCIGKQWKWRHIRSHLRFSGIPQK